MANIKDLKVRIKSTKNTFKITSAMKLVSAAKLSKAQGRIQGLRPYVEELDTTVRTVSAIAKGYEHPYFEVSENKKSVLLVISSNKGLCGGYNNQLAKNVRKFLETDDNKENFQVFYIGKKVRELVSNDFNSIKSFEFEGMDPTVMEIRNVANELSSMFSSGEVGNVYVAYNKFLSAIAFDSTIKQVLPLTLTEAETEQYQEEFPFDFKYAPSAETILNTLIPEVYQSSIQTSIYDAIASEHGSRMSAMENASKNCKEMIKKLTLKMNKLRQAAITTELIEVVSGAESLNG